MTRFLVWLVIGASAGFGQTPKFEVASIKPSDPGGRGMSMRGSPGGGVIYKDTTLKSLVVNAWGVQQFLVSGGPAWIETARFDIDAKPEKPPQKGEQQLMMQELLKDRFQLVVRKETREMPIYNLVLARKDGKLGPQLKESTCIEYDREHPPPQGTMPCGSGMVGNGKISLSGAQMPGMIVSLSSMAQRTVVDQTGLIGKYDVTLNWSNDLNQSDGSSGSTGPSIFTALEEQLGLKLVSTKGPVDMLVIEKAEKPTEN